MFVGLGGGCAGFGWLLMCVGCVLFCVGRATLGFAGVLLPISWALLVHDCLGFLASDKPPPLPPPSSELVLANDCLLLLSLPVGLMLSRDVREFGASLLLVGLAGNCVVFS